MVISRCKLEGGREKSKRGGRGIFDGINGMEGLSG
jgi:hypothetical protein